MIRRSRRRSVHRAPRSFVVGESPFDALARAHTRASATIRDGTGEKEPASFGGEVRFAPSERRVIGTGAEAEALVAPAGTPAGMPATATRDIRLGRETVVMMGGTLLSRVTGLLRLLVAAYALGIGYLSDAFNLANNTPNIVHDLVLGGVLSATFVPVFVDRVSNKPRKEATESISAVVTLGAAVLLVATGVFVLVSPYVIDLYSLGTHTAHIGLERQVATELLRMFALQLLGYGAISLMTAILNAARHFALPAYVPVVNNVIAIAVLIEFAELARHPTVGFLAGDHGLLLFLGFGTTAGVIAQAIFLVPSTLRCGLRVRFRWAPRDDAVREVVSLSGWTLGFVVANQVALFVTLAVAVHIDPSGGAVTAYTYAFTFFQLPYGMIAVSVMSAITPDLAEKWSLGEKADMARSFGLGLRRMMAGIWPATVGYLLLAGPIMSLLLLHGNARARGVHLTGSLLALLALGLPGYCVYLLSIRALQSMRDTRTAFFLYLAENGLNVVFLFVLTPLIGPQGLALSFTVAYSAAGLAALGIARHKMGGIGGRESGRFLLRALALSIAMGLCVAVVTAAVGSGAGLGLVERVVAGVVVGLAVYGGGAALAGAAGRGGRRIAGKGT